MRMLPTILLRKTSDEQLKKRLGRVNDRFKELTKLTNDMKAYRKLLINELEKRTIISTGEVPYV